MPFSTATGPKIYYEVSGEGPALVFVHANPFDHRLWLYQVARFSPFFRCVAMDSRGYGRSDKVETPFTLADMKDDVLGVCRKEGIESAIFCGCSVGSGIALLTGLDHPEMTRALILVGGNSRGSAGVRKRAEDFSKTKDVPGMIRDHLHEVFAPSFPATARGRWIVSIFAENAHTLSGAAIAQIHRARGGCDMSGRLKELEVPTLVINGAHDNSLAAGRETAAGIKSARHVELPGTGHACCIEDPGAFDRAIIEFFKQNGLWAGSTIPPLESR
jgi:pimeloyl-ACP methyl ester carboxylesterase